MENKLREQLEEILKSYGVYDALYLDSWSELLEELETLINEREKDAIVRFAKWYNRGFKRLNPTNKVEKYGKEVAQISPEILYDYLKTNTDKEVE